MTDSERIAALEKIVGAAYMNGPQLSKEQFFAQMLKPANELPSGDYNNGVLLKLTQYIIADQRAELDALKAENAAQSARIAALENAPVLAPVTTVVSGNVSAGAVDLPGFGNGIHLKSGPMECLIFTSSYDNAMRILSNHKADTLGGHTHAIESLPQLRIDLEQDGVVGMGYWKPRKKPDGSVLAPGPYDLLGGKAICFKPGGSDYQDGRRGKYAEIYSGHTGRGLRFGVCQNMANVVDRWALTIEPDGTFHG